MEAKENQPQKRLELQLNTDTTGVVNVALGTENRVLASVALDLMQEIYAKLLDKTEVEAKAHVTALYAKYYDKYMAESQEIADGVLEVPAEK